VKLTLDLSESTLRLLEVVGNGHAETALLALVERATQGVTRPGCWERAWVRQVFGDEWIEQMEEDPQAYWRQRPRCR
jgi:hypothetical protein